VKTPNSLTPCKGLQFYSGLLPSSAGWVPLAAGGPRLFTYVMICQRIGSGIVAQVGIPFGKLPFFNNQKISPSVACCTRSLRKLGLFPRPNASWPWHFAQWSSKSRFPADTASACPAYGFARLRSASGTCFSQLPSAARQIAATSRVPHATCAIFAFIPHPLVCQCALRRNRLKNCSTSYDTLKRHNTPTLFEFNPKLGSNPSDGPFGMFN
jgi:hypothetical protein